MRTIFILLICLVSIFMMTKEGRGGEKTTALVFAGADTVSFKTQIQPILQKNCTPCHFPGGKMYGKMPFDKGETIISHEAGILKRIKRDDELALFKQFIQQSK